MYQFFLVDLMSVISTTGEVDKCDCDCVLYAVIVPPQATASPLNHESTFTAKRTS